MGRPSSTSAQNSGKGPASFGHHGAAFREWVGNRPGGCATAPPTRNPLFTVHWAFASVAVIQMGAGSPPKENILAVQAGADEYSNAGNQPRHSLLQRGREFARTHQRNPGSG